LLACNKLQSNNTNYKTVYIKEQKGKYTLIRNGKPFLIKGGAGFTNLKRLHEAGGNTIRVWDTLHLAQILDSAQANQLAVIVGIQLPPNGDMDSFYNNAAKVKANYKKIAATINRYKNHPALLCWCLGNELSFPYKPKYNTFYRVFNSLIDLIHSSDPNHPVTTTVMTFQKKNIINMKLRTDIDFISFNLFGALQTFNKDLDDFKWFWNGPFLVTEWGIEGPWAPTEQNAWGSFIENTSLKKAEQYLESYQKYMPVDNPRYLGSMVFYWGQKQEFTPTWFSLFDENGMQTETVNILQYIWTGKPASIHAPSVRYMLLNDKGAKDNIFLKPNLMAKAKVYMNEPDTGKLIFKWRLYPEDWYKPNGIFREKKSKEIANIISENNRSEIEFKVPDKEGPYRLIVYVYNGRGYFSTTNTPFYVVNNP